METTVAGFTFFSNFDSGNLHKVLLDVIDTDDEGGHASAEKAAASDCPPPPPMTPRQSSNRRKKRAAQVNSTPLGATDYAFKIWTRPDCAGTEFENGNRTWFFFAFNASPQVFVMPGSSANNGGKVVKFTVMNLNKQSKLFSQGMTPIIQVVPQGSPLPSYHAHANGGWERIKERPTYFTSSNTDENGGVGGGTNFSMSFRVLCQPHTTTYLAFTYPYTYRDLQAFLAKLEKKHGAPAEKNFEALSKMSPTTLYFHRENLCYSLEKRRVDVLTISSLTGLLPEREDKLDKLFPDIGCDNIVRPFKFSPSKKIVFVSARVHPGETQSSFVLIGFLKFLLRESDPRSMALRKKYVFKLIPMLNPDGVVNGHYRTDCRGVNLNRVYARPIFELHPQIYAARKLLLYAHHRKEIFEDAATNSVTSSSRQRHVTGDDDELCDDKKKSDAAAFRPFQLLTKPDSDTSLGSIQSSDSFFSSVASLTPSKHGPHLASGSMAAQLGYEMTETSRFSEGDESIADFSERHGFAVGGSTPVTSSHRNILPPQPVGTSVGPTTFAAAFAKGLPSPTRRRNLSSSNRSDSGLSSLRFDASRPAITTTTTGASVTTTTARRHQRWDSTSVDTDDVTPIDDDVVSNNNNDDDDDHGIVDDPESPDLVGEEENANLDFVRPFVVSSPLVDRTSGSSFASRRPMPPLMSAFHDPERRLGPLPDVVTASEQQHLSSVETAASSMVNSGVSSAVVPTWDAKTSGLFMYIDIHGHASKRGIFMYGNYFDEVETQASSMLLPKLMSINCANFDFPACNFTERNMYLKDRHTGAGREGSGRVSVYKSTGLIHSYTLECNFNTGRVVNGVPMASRDAGRATPPPPPHPSPQSHPSTGTTPNSTLQELVAPKYTPEIYEDSGKALATSLLDMTESNPWTRLTCSAFKNLRGVREWLRKYIRASKSSSATSAGLADEGADSAGSRGRGSLRRRSNNSESSIKRFAKTSTPVKFDMSSPTRSLRSLRRARTNSLSAATTVSGRKLSLPSGVTATPSVTKTGRKKLSAPVATSDVTVASTSSSSEPAQKMTRSNSVLSDRKTLTRSGSKQRRLKKRVTSAGARRTESQSCPNSRPASAANPATSPNHDLPSLPASPKSPPPTPSTSLAIRRSFSTTSLKGTRSRPSSPSRSGRSSPVYTALPSTSSVGLLPRVLAAVGAGQKFRTKKKKTRKKLVDASDATSASPSNIDADKEIESPKMTPKKKAKINSNSDERKKSLKRR